MGDNSKILFSIMMFSYPDNSGKKISHPGGSQWGPGALLARFRAKMAIFEQIPKKIQVFFCFLRVISHPKTDKTLYKASHKNLMDHRVQKEDPKASKMAIFGQKTSFFI